MEYIVFVLIALIVISFLLSHNKDEYLIKKNRHYYSGLRLFRFSKKLTEASCTFTSSCLYDESKLSSAGWNKLWGISTPFIHKNSARVGWRCENGDIRVSSYCYVNGERLIKDMGIVPVDVEVYIEVEITEDGYYVRVDNREHFTPNKNKSKLFFRCFPYFGGKSKAPHDMKIFIREF